MPNVPTNPALRYIRVAADDHTTADRDLLARAADRDEAAVAALVRRHGPMVLGVCYRVLGHREDAEDAFQATFLALVRAAGSLRPRETVGGWLRRVAHRVAQKARVAAARRRTREGKAARGATAGPVDELTVREAGMILEDELARLPDKLRMPLVLCCLDGLSRDEAAVRLGWPAVLVKSRLEQARERLATRLSARGLTLPGALAAVLVAGPGTAAVPPGMVETAVGAAVAPPARVAALADGIRAAAGFRLKAAAAILLGAVALAAGASGGGPAVGTPGLPPTPDRVTATPSKAGVADLTAIDRTIRKEPAYKTKTPRYCLLVLGPGAKTRVWLVHDGDDLYVDRNGNGDLTEAGERVPATAEDWVIPGAADKDRNNPTGTLVLRYPFKVGELAERDGKTKYAVRVLARANADSERYGVAALVDDTFLQMTDAGYHMTFAARPKDAPVVHLNGPLGFRFWSTKDGEPWPLVRGDRSAYLIARFGTPGLGSGSEAWVTPFKGIPDDVSPVADVEFPSRDPNGRPIRVRVAYTRRGVGNSLFLAPISVPDGAADGRAKVTVSFPDWTVRRVAPVTYEVAVETPKPEKKP